MKKLICILFLAGLWIASAQSQPAGEAEGVTVKGEQVYAVRGTNLTALAENLQFPFDVLVTTNGTFKVAHGKERRLNDGQTIRRDGWLLNADGSLQPVFDHVTMKEGKVLVVRDGQAETLTQPMDFPNGMNITPDGDCTYPDGHRLRLLDGQLFRMDGTPITAKDTVSLKNGRVVVQKNGTLITLAPVQIMDMNDGSRVRGDGQVQKLDGTTFQLSEGQTILVDGALLSH